MVISCDPRFNFGLAFTVLLLAMITVSTFDLIPNAEAMNANLFVSAENSQFDNYMSGPQVVEVVIVNSSIDDTDVAYEEPDVVVNGKSLRMVQGVDGNWYGYFADLQFAQIADFTATVAGEGTDFGSFCDNTLTIEGDSTGLSQTLDFTDTDGVAINETLDSALSVGSETGNTISASCIISVGESTSTNNNNVVREAVAIAAGSVANSVPAGQVGAQANLWPFIQLFDLTPTAPVLIQYNKNDVIQSTTLTFDDVDHLASITLDRTEYPIGAEVHVTIADPWLNIDPTDEDSWTFDTVSGSLETYYQVFDEHGGNTGDVNSVTPITSKLNNLMCGDNCELILTSTHLGSDIVTIQDTADSVISITGDPESALSASSAGGTLATGTQPITITETSSRSSTFVTFGEDDVSALRITDSAPRGLHAVIDYNSEPTSIRVGFDSATLDLQTSGNWRSGFEVPIYLTDDDQNKNSLVDEDLDVHDPDVAIIPAMSTGDPFTLGEGTTSPTVGFYLLDVSSLSIPFTGVKNGNSAVSVIADSTSEVQRFSERMIVTTDPTGATSANLFVVELDTNLSNLRNSINDAHDISGNSEFRGTNLLNFDMRGLKQESSLSTVEIYLVLSSSGDIINDATKELSSSLNFISLANTTSLQDLISLNSSSTSVTNATTVNQNLFGSSFNDSDLVGLAYQFNPYIPNGEDKVLVTDFFSFGFDNDGDISSERVSNQILRFELEESQANSSTFVGTVKYTMVNQLNVLDSRTYELEPISDDVTFVVIENMDGIDKPRIDYDDKDESGTTTQISDNDDIKTHSGSVVMHRNSFGIGSNVHVTLFDRDLNTDSSFLDVFTVVTNTDDPAYSTIGKANLLSSDRNGNNFDFGLLGTLLTVQIDDEAWANAETSINGVSCIDNISDFNGIDTGLADAGFTLIETSSSSGIFSGDFEVPSVYCKRSGSTGSAGEVVSTDGSTIKVSYVDFRDATGQIAPFEDSATITSSGQTTSNIYENVVNLGTEPLVITNSTFANNTSIFATNIASPILNITSVSDTGLPNDIEVLTNSTAVVFYQNSTFTLNNGTSQSLSILEFTPEVDANSIDIPSGFNAQNVVAIGPSDAPVLINSPIRVTIFGSSGFTPFYSQSGEFNEITNQCQSDTFAVVNAQLNGDECFWDNGVDLIIWTEHLTSFGAISASGSGSGCRGDCTPPTMGIDRNGIVQVENGFSYNGNPINVKLFHTSYPLITTEVGQNNTVVVKVYENNGPGNILLVQFGIGTPEIGSSLNDSEVLVELWLESNETNIPMVKQSVIRDAYNLIENDSVTTKTDIVKCTSSSLTADCLEITMNYVYREPPLYNVMIVEAVDLARHTETNYFNDGINVIGESLNEPDVLQILPVTTQNYPQKRGLIELVELDRSEQLWMDKFGYVWQGDKSKISLQTSIPFELHHDKISKFHGYNDRMNSNFGQYLQEQISKAEDTFNEIVFHKEIQGDDLIDYEAETIYFKITKHEKLKQAILEEIQKAEIIRAQMDEK